MPIIISMWSWDCQSNLIVTKGGWDWTYSTIEQPWLNGGRLGVEHAVECALECIKRCSSCSTTLSCSENLGYHATPLSMPGFSSTKHLPNTWTSLLLVTLWFTAALTVTGIHTLGSCPTQPSCLTSWAMWGSYLRNRVCSAPILHSTVHSVPILLLVDCLHCTSARHSPSSQKWQIIQVIATIGLSCPRTERERYRQSIHM